MNRIDKERLRVLMINQVNHDTSVENIALLFTVYYK